MDKNRKIPVIIIGGPTAVGKTALSIELAKAFNGEVINGDSLQVYRGLNIGTGKVTDQEKDGVVHHLLDILEVDQQFDAHQFKHLAAATIEMIYRDGKLPIICGGTGLYLEGLLFDFSYGGQVETPESLRRIVEDKFKNYSNEEIWAVLQNKDNDLALTIPRQNRRRLLRALEVYENTGQSILQQREHELQKSNYDYLFIVLDRERQELYQLINQRVDLMVEQGLEEEVWSYYQTYQGQLVAGMKGIGYKEWWPYFQGNLERQQVIEMIQQNSRRYAKRQLTWFRNRFKETHWINANQASNDALKLVNHWLTKEK